MPPPYLPTPKSCSQRFAISSRNAPSKAQLAAPLRIDALPKWLICVPLVAQWFYLAARFRSLTLPSAINPGIETGGLAGESKADCLALIPRRFAPWIAGWEKVLPGQAPNPPIAYPIIAKPDIGWCGYGVRRLDSPEDLAAYQSAFPPDAAYLLQTYIPGPMEAGLFYIRQPGARHGTLLSITLRHAPPHTTVASLRCGATYEDATAHATPRLLARIDAIARAMPGFQLGRFDVRFTTLAQLQRGHFTIIEVNGAGSEAIHLWDPRLPIDRSFAGIFAKQTLLFQLGAAMRALGHEPVGTIALSRAWIRQQRLIARYPASN